MSTAMAISGVTGVLQSMLNEVYNNPAGSPLGSVKVSATAPDIVQAAVGTSSEAALQVNLFLHQVTPNAAWRNLGLPSLAPDGSTRLTNPPLALDLHYLLTVYAGADGMAEALLGYAIQMLHDYSILSRTQVRSFLSSSTITGLQTSGLADQVEQIKITPDVFGREELAWIWTALKADYRLSYPFQVSVVLIQSQFPTVSALPALSVRSSDPQPGLLATISQLNPPVGHPAAILGDVVAVSGQGLGQASSVLLINSRWAIQQTVTGLTNIGNTSFQFTVPNPNLTSPQPNPTDLPAGVYLLSAQVQGQYGIASTNGLALAIAPTITSSPIGPLTHGANTITVSCKPYLRVGQRVSLLVGDQEVVANAFLAPTNSPSFTFPHLQATGGVPAPLRLRVDGIDSPVAAKGPTGLVFSGPSIQVN
jgi:Pvc16 N-terminal domain